MCNEIHDGMVGQFQQYVAVWLLLTENDETIPSTNGPNYTGQVCLQGKYFIQIVNKM